MADGDRPKTSNTRRNAEKTSEYSPLALQIRHQSKLKLPIIDEVDEEEEPQIKHINPQIAISDTNSNASTQASFNAIKEENLNTQNKHLDILNIKRPSKSAIEQGAQEILQGRNVVIDKDTQNKTLGYKKLTFSNSTTITPTPLSKKEETTIAK